MSLTFTNASLITAIKTPFKENGKIDLEAYDALVTRQIKYGVEGIIVGGTTGEGHLLSWEEHIMLIAYSVNNFKDKLLIVGNTGSNNTKEAINATEQGFSVGMHVALQINPYYGKTSTQGLINHFNRVLEIGPGLIYNVPTRTAQDVMPDIIKRIAEKENFIGVKECQGNERIKSYEDIGIPCWSGVDQECGDARHKSGGHGVISVAANFYPQAFREIMDDPNSNKIQLLSEFHDLLYAEPNPIGLNTLLAMSGLARPVFRMPYAPLSKEQRQKLFDIVADLGLVETPENMQVLNDEDFTLV